MTKRKHRQYPPLTREQQHLVKEHRWVAGTLAQAAINKTGGYTGSLTREDLESVANFAICVAAGRYEPSKKVRFSTFAWKTAEGYIKHALRDHSRLVKTPRWVANYKNQVDALLARKKTYSEIASELGIPESKVLIAEMTSQNFHVSYDSSPEDWVSKEFVFNDDDVKPYLVSPELIAQMKKLTEGEMNLIVKFVEDQPLSPEDREWASEKFHELHSIAHGFSEDSCEEL